MQFVPDLLVALAHANAKTVIKKRYYDQCLTAPGERGESLQRILRSDLLLSRFNPVIPGQLLEALSARHDHQQQYCRIGGQ